MWYPLIEPQMTVKTLPIAYNKSDVTFGWNGFTNALTLYYLTPDEQFVTHDHAYPLGVFY